MSQSNQFQLSRRAAPSRLVLAGTILALAAAAVCPPARAEIIVRKDGRKIEGQIVKEDATFVTIQTAYGSFRVSKEQIASIEGRRAISQAEREAKEALAVNDLDRALEKLQAALKEATEAEHRKMLEELAATVRKQIQDRDEKRFASQLSTADRLIQEKRFADARAELKKLLDRNPEPNPAAKIIRKRISRVYMAEAAAYKDMINYPEATDMYKKAIDETPDDPEPYLMMARFLVGRDAKPTEIIDYYVKAIERALRTQKESELLDDYYKLACAYLKAGAAGKEPDEKLLREGIKCLLIVSRDGGTSYTTLAAAKLEDGFVMLGKTNYDTDAMIKMLESTLEINPRAQKARWILADVYSKKRQHGKVIEQLTKIEANARAGGDVIPEELYYRLGLAYLAGPNPEYDKALQAFENEIRQNKLNYMALIKAAEIHTANGTYDDALNYCDQAIALRRERPEAYLVAAEARIRRMSPDDFQQAQMYLRTALNLKSDFQPARIKLAEIEVLQQVKSEIPNYQPANLLLDQVLSELGDVNAKLSEDDRKARAEALLLKAKIEEDMKNSRAALDTTKQALAAWPDMPEAYRLQGQIQKGLSFFDEARKSLLKAIELDQRTPETYLLLGRLCDENLKSDAEAIKYYQEYLKHGGKDTVTVKRWIEQCQGRLGTGAGAGASSGTVAGAPATSGTVAPESPSPLGALLNLGTPPAGAGGAAIGGGQAPAGANAPRPKAPAGSGGAKGTKKSGGKKGKGQLNPPPGK